MRNYWLSQKEEKQKTTEALAWAIREKFRSHMHDHLEHFLSNIELCGEYPLAEIATASVCYLADTIREMHTADVLELRAEIAELKAMAARKSETR